jgi:stage V sporulation protein AD
LKFYRRGRSTSVFPHLPVVRSTGSVVGPREASGPLGHLFDVRCKDTLLGETSWEKAETRMIRHAVDIAIAKCGKEPIEIDYFIAGDLLNQIISSGYAARELDIPFLGLYGACATMGEALSLASMLISGGFARYIAVASSSHHDTAERQFRYPTEFGYQRVPSSQWTVTGAGAAIVSCEGEGPCIEAVTVGRVHDMGVTDANDLGSAMAPAFADTVWRHLNDMGRKPEHYDLIISGDLGKIGVEMGRLLLTKKGINLEGLHQDSGLMIYEMKPEICSGASGCGCIACVFAAKIWRDLASEKLKRVLMVPTGAIHSPTACQQGESIPSIAHAVSLVSPSVAKTLSERGEDV